MRKLIKASILSGILVLGGLSWLAGPTSAYAAPLPLQGQTQQIRPEFYVVVRVAAAATRQAPARQAPATVATARVVQQAARWAAEAAVKAAVGYVVAQAAKAILNGQGPGNDPTIVPEEVF